MASPCTTPCRALSAYPRGARLHARRRVAVGGHQRGATAHVEQRRVLGGHGLRGRTPPHLGNPARPGSTAAP